MNRFAICFVLFLTNVALAATPGATGLPLVLVVGVTPSQVGQVIQLQDAKECRYFGSLEARGGENETHSSKVLNQARGHGATWSIAIKKQVCNSVERDVSYVIKLRNIVAEPEYAPGDKVMAYLSKH